MRKPVDGFRPHRWTVKQICNGWRDDNAAWWSELADVDMLEETEQEYGEAVLDLLREALQEELDYLEARYLRRHGRDVYAVTQAECCLSDHAANGVFNRDQCFQKEN